METHFWPDVRRLTWVGWRNYSCRYRYSPLKCKYASIHHGFDNAYVGPILRIRTALAISLTESILCKLAPSASWLVHHCQSYQISGSTVMNQSKNSYRKRTKVSAYLMDMTRLFLILYVCTVKNRSVMHHRANSNPLASEFGPGPVTWSE